MHLFLDLQSYSVIVSSYIKNWLLGGFKHHDNGNKPFLRYLRFINNSYMNYLVHIFNIRITQKSVCCFEKKNKFMYKVIF